MIAIMTIDHPIKLKRLKLDETTIPGYIYCKWLCIIEKYE